jgi:hypothetical protein
MLYHWATFSVHKHSLEILGMISPPTCNYEVTSLQDNYEIWGKFLCFLTPQIFPGDCFINIQKYLELKKKNDMSIKGGLWGQEPGGERKERV